MIFFNFWFIGERYDFVINADRQVGAYWIQLRGLGECGIRRVQQLAILRYARGPYQPSSNPPTYDFGIPQGVVSNKHLYIIFAKRDVARLYIEMRLLCPKLNYACKYLSFTTRKSNFVVL